MKIKDILSNKKLVVSIFALLLLIVISVVVSVCYNVSDDVDSNVENTTQSVSQADSNVLSGDSTFLVVIVNDLNKIELSLLADFKIYSQHLIITPLSSDTLSSDDRTYSESYSYGGINLLKSCIEETRNIDIDRYAVIDKSGFSKLTELMGEVLLQVEEDFSYETSDKTYSVSKGENEMGSDMLYTYIALLANRDNGEYKAAEIVCTVINSYLENIDSIDAEDMFGEVTNCFSTDVTISDYYTAESDIEYLLSNGFTCVISNDVDD